jgi:hypothetical protein
VEVLSLPDLGAVISHVSASEFSQERVDQSLQDLAWVAEQGIAHERVVAFFVDHAQILPASLFTLYSSDNALRSSVTAQHDAILAELRRLADVREWNLKISYDAGVLSAELNRFSAAVQRIDSEIVAAAPGRKFLLEKKRAELVKTEVVRAARAQAERVQGAVAPLCAETRTLPLPQSKDALPVVLHSALLVARDREEAVVQQLEQERAALGDSGLTLAFSGPWAPYRFVRHESA